MLEGEWSERVRLRDRTELRCGADRGGCGVIIFRTLCKGIKFLLIGG